MGRYVYLTDSAFLKEFDKIRKKEMFIKIQSLSFDEEEVLAEIQGRVTDGSINIDGSSSIRRTGSLSMVFDDYDYDYNTLRGLLSLNKKIDIEVGFLNTTSSYQDFTYIWFPMGRYVITQPSLSKSLDGITASLELQDKMCLLSGDVAGEIPASVNFSTVDTINPVTGEWITEEITIYEIIQELVNHWGGIPLNKIIISDVDTEIKWVQKWYGEDSAYLIKTIDSDGTYNYELSLDKPDSSQEYLTFNNGDTIGYTYSDFVWPGSEDLECEAGAAITTVLDEIKDKLGNYEYFFDIDGNFIFQEIKNYLNTSKATVDLENLAAGDYLIDMSGGKSIYQFDTGELIVSLSSTPQYSQIKNDFCIWGTRTFDGMEYPCRYHLAIDEKPEIGNTYKVIFYTDEDSSDSNQIRKAAVPVEYSSVSAFPATGQTGVIYTDGSDRYWTWDGSAYQIDTSLDSPVEITTTDWRTELYLQGVVAQNDGTDAGYYYAELANEWPKIYDIENGKFKDSVLSSPDTLDFFLDFIDSTAAVSELSVSNIGRRVKAISTDDVTCVFSPSPEDVVYIENGQNDTSYLREKCATQGQAYCQVPQSIFVYIKGGSDQYSGFEYAKDLLYQYTNYNESISLTTIPVYYLEPNTRISVTDNDLGIYGDYIINSISIPLGVGQTMSISAQKALDKI